LSEELTDAFDTLDLHVFYRDGCVDAVEFGNTASVVVGGHCLGDQSLATMAGLLDDPLVPLIQTPTSVQSLSLGVQFSVARLEDRETIGAIGSIIVVSAGYFDRSAELLAKLS
jgi:hypothetical protein